MIFRLTLGRAVAAILLAMLGASPVWAQDHIQRISGLVTVAVAEYGRGFDGQGPAPGEYAEAVEFLADAHRAAQRLPSEMRQAAAILDTIIAAVQAKRPPSELSALLGRFVGALGSGGALDLPKTGLRPDSGQVIYLARCAQCHGAQGMGDGPAGAKMNPRPPALADVNEMRSETPELMYRKIEIGVMGTAMPAFGGQLSSADRWNVVAYLTGLRHQRSNSPLGEGLYVQNCASCHGVRGTGDGPLAHGLSKLPAEIGSFAWQAQRSDSVLGVAIRNGVVGSPMPPMAGLTLVQERSLVAYLRSLALRDSMRAAPADSSDPERSANESLGLLEQSLLAAKTGRIDEAVERATDAYASFEPLEFRSRPKNPGLVSTMELTYGRFKEAIRANDIRGAESEQVKIEGNMPAVLALTTPTGSGFEAFWQSFLIILREGFEAILVVGAVVAFLLKTGHRERLRSIWFGVGLAIVASAVTAILLSTMLSAIPASREIIEGCTLLVAVIVLFSVSYWLISRVEAAKWQQFIKEKVNIALDQGGDRALAVVAFLAVYREGAETALFYQALFHDGAHVVLPLSLGIIAGGIALAIVFTLFYRFGVRIPLRPFFAVTSVLLYYMAFVFIGKAFRELQEGDAIPATFISRFPTIDAMGIYPTWQTLLAQLVLVVLFAFALLKTFWPRRSVLLPTFEPGTAADQRMEQAIDRITELEKTVARLKRD